MKNKSQEYNIGLAIIFFFSCVALVSAFYTPHDAYTMLANAKMKAPSFEFFFGTDNLGRDILSRTMVGIRYTLLFSVITLFGSGIFGITIGLICSRVSSIWDQIIIRIIDTINAIPSVLLALVLMSVLKKGNISLILSLIVIFIPAFARISRNEAIQIRELEYIQHTELLGASNLRVMFIHILPNIYPSVVSTAIIVITNSIVVESALSYLGVGIQPPVPSLGRMMYDSQTILIDAPWAALIPGICVVLIIIGFNCIGSAVENKGKKNGKTFMCK